MLYYFENMLILPMEIILMTGFIHAYVKLSQKLLNGNKFITIWLKNLKKTLLLNNFEL